jgi:hypothetical protein
MLLKDVASLFADEAAAFRPPSPPSVDSIPRPTAAVEIFD